MTPETVPPIDPAAPQPIAAEDVHDVLGQRILADGLPLVFDPARSKGAHLFDSRSGRSFVDFFGFFASQPVGYNHPSLCDEKWTQALGEWARHKPANSDVYTVPFAHFVDTFQRVAMAPEMAHLFLISGGALAVENALKVAFDWKCRKNLAAGSQVPGDQVAHLRHAFHGRSGYTLSLTNTDPTKTDLFPKFDWPRLPSPYCSHPLEGAALEQTRAREQATIDATRSLFEERAERIAAFLLEPIQCEGGDNHFRPEFLRELRALCDRHEVLLVFDEVQTGLGATGTMWAYQQLGVVPDIVAFGKKVQVCGIMATNRVDDVEENVFHRSSRINSTWGGNLVDMIRSTRVLEIMEREGLVENARQRGDQFLAGLQALAAQHPDLVTNCRGRGLIAAFDLPTRKRRDGLLQRCYDDGLLVLACGERSVRFRPVLDIDAATIDEGLELLGRALKSS